MIYVLLMIALLVSCKTTPEASETKVDEKADFSAINGSWIELDGESECMKDTASDGRSYSIQTVMRFELVNRPLKDRIGLPRAVRSDFLEIYFDDENCSRLLGWVRSSNSSSNDSDWDRIEFRDNDSNSQELFFSISTLDHKQQHQGYVADQNGWDRMSPLFEAGEKLIPGQMKDAKYSGVQWIKPFFSHHWLDPTGWYKYLLKFNKNESNLVKVLPYNEDKNFNLATRRLTQFDFSKFAIPNLKD